MKEFITEKPHRAEDSRETRNVGKPDFIKGRRRWLFAMLALFLASTAYFCLLQQPWADPEDESHTGWGRWFVHPLESNPLFRLASMPADALLGVHFADARRGWVVGAKSLILHTDNGGKSWELQTNIDLSAFIERTPEKALSVIVPPQFVAQMAPAPRENTYNQAAPQNLRSVPPRQRPSSLGNLTKVVFHSDGRHGCAGGENGLVLITTNGGNAWSARLVPDYPDIITLALPSPTNCWVGTRGALWHCSDGGSRWQKASFNGTLGFVHFSDPDHGWALSDSGCWRTQDGGARWTLAGEFSRAPGVDKSQTLGFEKQSPSDSGEPETQIQGFAAFGTNHAWLLRTPENMLRTADGGSTWKPESVKFTGGTPRGPFAVAFVSETEGWCVAADDRRLWHTLDGGVTWSSSASSFPGEYGARQVFFASRRTGWVVGDSGHIFATSNGGKSWRKLTTCSSTTCASVGFVDRQRGLALDAMGKAFRTTDGGATWSRVSPPWGTNATFEQFHAPSGLTLARSVSDLYGMSLWYTPDAGGTWRAVAPKVPFEEILAGDSNPLLVSGRFEQRNPREIYLLADSGKTWTPFRFSKQSEKQVGHFEGIKGLVVQKQLGWALRDDGTAWRSLDAGRSWTNVLSATNGKLWSLSVSGQEATIAASAGPLEHRFFTFVTENSGGTWNTNETPTELDPIELELATPRTGWALGRGGIIFATTNAGRLWTPQYTNAALSSGHIFALNDEQAWVAGARRLVARTTDGGRRWQVVTRYRCWPAPAYVVCLLLTGFCLYGARRTVPKELDLGADSITNHAVSDNPLDAKTAGGHDMLGFGDLAAGIANYLENPNTRGPLTLAVLGPWGSGKSSLMNLLCARLREHGMGTVWFNAWHEEQGDQDKLLAKLLDRIRSKAPPPLFVPGGLRFRCRLLLHRLRKRKELAALLGSLILVVAVWIHKLWTGWESSSVSDFISRLVELLPFGPSTETLPKEGGWLTNLLQLLPLGGLAPVVYYIIHLMSAFNVDPARLIARGKGTGSEGKQSLVTRSRFQEELNEVLEVLYPDVLVIFVDDLDRCDPPQVMSMLQALNFLSSSGECFIVVGMQEKSVQEGIVKAYEWRGRIARPSGQKLTGDEQWQFAQDWMEKLIQIRVVVPKLTSEQSKNMLESRNSSVSLPETRKPQSVLWSWSRLIQAVRAMVQAIPTRASNCWRAAPRFVQTLLEAVPFAVALGLLVWGAWALGRWLPIPQERPVGTMAKGANAGATNHATTNLFVLGLNWTGSNLEFRVVSHPHYGGTNQAPGESGATNSPSAPLAGATNASLPKGPAFGERVTLPATTETSPFIIAGSVVGLLLLVLSLYILLLQPIVRISDSLSFKTALEEWMPVIRHFHTTPRAIKRLINRLRFRAMVMRDPNDREGRSRVPEQDIVAYGILEAICPALLEDSTTPPDVTQIQAYLPDSIDLEARKAFAAKAVAAVKSLRSASDAAFLERLTSSVSLDSKSPNSKGLNHGG